MADADDDPFWGAISHRVLENVRCRLCGNTELLWVEQKPKAQGVFCRKCNGPADVIPPEKPHGQV